MAGYQKISCRTTGASAVKLRVTVHDSHRERHKSDGRIAAR